MAKPPKSKKDIFTVKLTGLSLRELKKSLPESEKIIHVDVPRIVLDNFGTECEMNDIRYWIVNQIIVKKIESFRAAKIPKIWIILDNPDKKSTKSFKELLKEHKISPLLVEIHA